MAANVTLVADFNVDVRADTDLRSAQYRVVQYNATGVHLASNASVGSGGFWILGNKPNSGQDCQLVGGPNLTKTVVATIIPRNSFVYVVSGGLVGLSTNQGSLDLTCIGKAITASGTGSGEIITVRLWC